MIREIILIFFMFICENLYAKTVFDITDEEYYRLPELFTLDNYDKCLSQPDGVYCMGDFELFPLGSSQIYETLLLLTEDTLINFNHTRIHRGICLGSLGSCPLQPSVRWEESFEDCVSKDIREKYGLQAKLYNIDYCKNGDFKRIMTKTDYIFMYYIAFIVCINVIGTVYDVFNKHRSKGNSWLLAFSLRQNWRKLTNKSNEENEFQCFHGMRAIMALFVQLAHVAMAIVAGYLPNPRQAEQNGHRPAYALFANGALMLQSFIVMTSFLRTVKSFNEAKKSQLGLGTILRAIVERFIRISPVYMTVVALSATMMVHIGDGPLWSKFMDQEAELCRDTFWRQFFFLQNLYPPSCQPQAWYLATDFQLYIAVAVITVVMSRKRDRLIKILSSLLIVFLIINFLVAYILELKPGLQIMTPENFLVIFREDKSFHLMYQSFWGNFPSAIIGIMATHYYYYIKESNIDLRKNQWFVIAFRLSVPGFIIYSAMGMLLFAVSSHFTVSFYTSVDKPGFALITCVFILGCIFKVGELYRNFIEWPGWVVPSRLALGSLGLHTTVIRVLVCSRLYPLNISMWNILADGFAVSALTFLLSVPLCLMVEYPFTELYKTAIQRTRHTTHQVNEQLNASNNYKTKDN